METTLLPQYTVDSSTAANASLELGDSRDEEAAAIRRTADSLLKYLIPVIVVVGTIGNTLSFIVLVRRHMRTKSVYFYLMLLACADTSVLYMGALKTWVRVAYGFELLHHSSVACKSYWFFMAVTLHMSAWLIVFVTMDRYVAVIHPLRANSFCTARRAGIYSLVGFLIFSVYNGHLFWNVHLQYFKINDSITTKCGPLAYTFFMDKVYNYMKCATYSVIPFVLVLSLNIRIICQLSPTMDGKEESVALNGSTQSPDRVAVEAGSRGCPSLERDLRRITIMLLFVSFSWLLLTFPFTLYSLIPREVASQTSYTKAVYHFSTVVCYLFLWTNHSINFFLYCVSGQKLRMELYSLFCMNELARRRNRFKQHQTSLRTQRTFEGNQGGDGTPSSHRVDILVSLNEKSGKESPQSRSSSLV